MTSVYILPQQGTPDELADFQNLIEKVDCSDLINSSVTPDEAGFTDVIAKTDVLAVLLGSGAANLTLLDAATKVALKYGSRIVGVWLPNTEGEEIPLPLQKFGAGLVRWDLVELEHAICLEETVWQGPGGGPAKTKPPKRNKC